MALVLRRDFGFANLSNLKHGVEFLLSAQPSRFAKSELSGGTNRATSTLGSGMLETLLQLLVAEKTGWETKDQPELDSLRQFTDRVSRSALDSIESTLSEAGVT